MLTSFQCWQKTTWPHLYIHWLSLFSECLAVSCLTLYACHLHHIHISMHRSSQQCFLHFVESAHCQSFTTLFLCSFVIYNNCAQLNSCVYLIGSNTHGQKPFHSWRGWSLQLGPATIFITHWNNHKSAHFLIWAPDSLIVNNILIQTAKPQSWSMFLEKKWMNGMQTTEKMELSFNVPSYCVLMLPSY
jgi:hypothetical protein